MGKHDANYKAERSSYLDGVDNVKKEGLWIIRNFKMILIIALIPAVGFGAYYLTKYFANNKKNNNTTPVYAVAQNIKSDDKVEKEYVGGYEVLGEIKIAKAGVNVKILNPELNGQSYIDDSLKNGAILYYGEELNELGNTVILGHNTANSFLGLKDVKLDDSITVVNQKGISKNYTVTKIAECEPDDFSSFLPMEKNSREITLITCKTDGTQRLVIKAIAK